MPGGSLADLVSGSPQSPGEAAPDQIKRYYSAGQKLLPVFVQPSPETQRWMAFRVESVVKLP